MAKKHEKNKAPSKVEHNSTDLDWSIEMIKNFIKILMDVTLCSNVKELKNHAIPQFIWVEVEKRIKLDHKALKDFWVYRLHMQLFSPQPIYLNNIKIQLIEYLYEKKFKSVKEVNWPNIKLHFDGFTRQFLYRVFNNLMIIAKANVESKHFLDQITYLYEECIPTLIDEPTDKILPRISYSEEKIEWIDTGLNLEGFTDN